MEALRCVLLCEEEVEDEEEPVAEECLLVPLVMGLGRTLARDRVLAERASLPSCAVIENRADYLCTVLGPTTCS